MKVGILETGLPPKSLQPRFGDYSKMFRDLLGPGLDYASFDVRAGELPAPQTCDAYVITGSAVGVYDDLPWIAPTIDWLRAARGQTKLVGVCFGHQIMAEAFGGKVIKSPKGWGVGLHRYDVVRPEPWIDADSFAIAASHQDQVVELPPDAEVIGASAFTPLAMLNYLDQPAISMQGHPEFTPDFASALIESRREERLTDEEAEVALNSLRQPNDRDRVGAWMRHFITG